MNIQEVKTKRDKQIAKLIETNRDRFNLIYPEGDGPENPVPENTHCIVICGSKDGMGWLEIHKTEDMGLEALIAVSWIKYEDLVV